MKTEPPIQPEKGLTRAFTFLLVEDHPLVRTGMVHLLQRLGEPVEVFEAGDCSEALALCRQHPDLDLVLLDLGLPGMDGFEGLARFRREFPSLPVVILSASDGPLEVRRAFEQGAQGYLFKTMSPGLMEQALRLVLEGGRYVPPTLLEPAPASPLQQLTPRQRDVLHLLEKGLSNKEIGRQLGLSDNTVRAHAAAIFRTLGVRNRTEAAHKLREYGLLSEDRD